MARMTETETYPGQKINRDVDLDDNKDSPRGGLTTEERRNLFESIKASYDKLEPFRKLKNALVTEYSGDGYGEATGVNSDDRRESIINLLNMAVTAYMMALASNRPQVLVGTEHLELVPFARHFQIAINNLFKEIKVKDTIQQWVMDAFFCIGIVKVHMADSGYVKLENDIWADPGKPYASNISLDNWFYDSEANKVSECQYMGDIYSVPEEDLEDEDVYTNREAVKNVVNTSKSERGDERLENLSTGSSRAEHQFRKMVTLSDVWIPRLNEIHTFACHFKNGRLELFGEALAIMDWEGGEGGNYKLLGFGRVPDNIMPSSPASHLASLHRHVNSVYRQQIKSARQEADVIAYAPGTEKDARRLQHADHQDMIEMQDPSLVRAFKKGGVSAALQQFMLNMRTDFDYAAGNITAILGLGAQSGTVGQERLIHAANSGKTAQMSQAVIDGIASLAFDLGIMLWNDKFTVIPGIDTDEASGMSVDSTWTPENREADFEQYNLDIDVHSIQYKSPGQRGQGLMQVIGFYAPFLQMMTQQGVYIDFSAVNQQLAELLDEPRLKQIVKYTAPMENNDPGPQGAPTAATARFMDQQDGRNQSQAPSDMQQQMQSWAQMGASGQQQPAIGGEMM